MSLGPIIVPFLAEIRRVWTGAMSRASVSGATPAPWDLSASATWSLVVVVNGAAPQTLSVLRASLADSTAATVAEVAAQLDAALVGGGAYALADGRLALEADPAVGGGATSIRVTGGTLNAVLSFPAALETQEGYDDVLGGVRPVDDGTQTGAPGRREHAAVSLRCQVDRSRWGEQRVTPGGLFDVAEIVLTLSARDLATRGLLRADGVPRLTRGDRLIAIRQTDGTIYEAFDDVRVATIERAGHGLSLRNPRPQLVYLHCERDRVAP